MSNVNRKGAFERPAWSHQNTQPHNPQWLILEMLESTRNVLEQIREEIRGIRACPGVNRSLNDIGKIRLAIERPFMKKRKKKAR